MFARKWFFSIKPEIFHQRKVVHGEENCGLTAGIGVLVPKRRRDDEEISLAPFVPLSVDHRLALAIKDVVDAAAGLPMSLAPNAGSDHLYAAREGRIEGTAGGRVHILHDDIVIRITGEFRQPAQ